MSFKTKSTVHSFVCGIAATLRQVLVWSVGGVLYVAQKGKTMDRNRVVLNIFDDVVAHA